jgi:cytochrome c553
MIRQGAVSVLGSMALTATVILGAPPARALDDITDANPARGRVLADAIGCAQCHGETGQGVQPGWPRLSGQYAIYIVNQLENFLSGRRPHPFMERNAAAMTSADMQDIALFYACQHPDRLNTPPCRGAR